MADTSKFKKIIEPWFRNEYLIKKYPNADIRQDKLGLIWGGHFEYDAVVYEDGEVVSVYLRSCSEYKTSSGNGGSGKFHKIKSDVLMMVGTDAPLKTMAFIGATMYEQFLKQQEMGRLPQDIRCELIELNDELKSVVSGIRMESSNEVSPQK